MGRILGFVGALAVALVLVAIFGELEIRGRADEPRFCELFEDIDDHIPALGTATGAELEHGLETVAHDLEEAEEVAPDELLPALEVLTHTANDYITIFDAVGYDRDAPGVAAAVQPLESAEVDIAVAETSQWRAANCARSE